MFERVKTWIKIRKFRGYNSVLKEFDPAKHVIQIQNGKKVVEISFRLMYFDCMYVAFSGDGICADADCLARVTELLWETEFPLNFPQVQVNELVAQVRKARLMNLAAMEESAEQGTGEQANVETSKDVLLEKELNRKIYFRDLNNWVMGNPNDVLVTLRLHRPIDR